MYGHEGDVRVVVMAAVGNRSEGMYKYCTIQYVARVP